MGNKSVINVKDLGKKYRIGEKPKSYKTLRDSIVGGFNKFGNNESSAKKRNKQKEFWALQNISFDVNEGDVVGIIGHNGAGKSTLLKILSRIIEPTNGYADIHGKVSSLLEVGTGFHPELTGRENIYLSGAIMGMGKDEIDRKFDEIVNFAGVEKFVDTPIKHYSSGMNLRLGFAVSAHLEPDILLVDEVLAVGDMEFQKKCLNKMENVANEGRTVLFVSHNMGSIKELCQKALVLKNGTIDYQGDVVSAIQHYSQNIIAGEIESDSGLINNGFTRLFINDGKVNTTLFNTDPFEVTVEFKLTDDVELADIHCYLDDSEGTQIFHNRELSFDKLEAGLHRINARIPPLYLRPGVYTLYFKLIGENQTQNDSQRVRYFSERLLVDISDKTEMFSGKVKALLLPQFEWKFHQQAKQNQD